jgi:hypothetical protein
MLLKNNELRHRGVWALRAVYGSVTGGNSAEVARENPHWQALFALIIGKNADCGWSGKLHKNRPCTGSFAGPCFA